MKLELSIKLEKEKCSFKVAMVVEMLLYMSVTAVVQSVFEEVDEAQTRCGTAAVTETSVCVLSLVAPVCLFRRHLCSLCINMVMMC